MVSGSILAGSAAPAVKLARHHKLATFIPHLSKKNCKDDEGRYFTDYPGTIFLFININISAFYKKKVEGTLSYI